MLILGITDASREVHIPLAVMLGAAGTVLASDDVMVRSSSRAVIVTEARRMGRLVDDLHFLAQSDSGAPLDTECVPVRRLLSCVIEPARMLIRRDGGRLSERVQAEEKGEVDPARDERSRRR